jgi:acetyl esterase/lipase
MSFKLTFLVLFLIASTPFLFGEGAAPAVLKDIPYDGDSNPQQTLDLYLPAAKPAPLILWVHGGGWKANDKSWILVPYLVAKGYAIASINYRYSSEAIFPAQIQDANDALNFLLRNADEYGLDKNRVAVAGDSAGGHLALLLGLARDEGGFGADAGVRPRAVIDFFGPTDFTVFTAPPPAGAEDVIAQLLGASPRDRPDLAKAASPVTYVTAASPPVLILHGDRDDVVPPGQSQVIADLLKKANVSAELVIIPGAGHEGPAFSSPKTQAKILQFLEQNLKP